MGNYRINLILILLLCSSLLGYDISNQIDAKFTEEEEDIFPKIVEIPEPQENDSRPFLEIQNRVIERGDTTNITFGMQNASNPTQYIAGYNYTLILDGPIYEVLIPFQKSAPIPISFIFETYSENNLTHYPAGNYTIRFIVHSIYRGILEVNQTLLIRTNPEADVKFIIAQVNRIGFAVNRSENIILVIENVGNSNAFDIKIDIQKIEPPLGLEQSTLPYHLGVLRPNRSESIYFRINPERLGIGVLELRTEFRNAENVANNDIIRLDIEVLPKVETKITIDPEIQFENITKISVEIKNFEITPIKLRNTLESDKIIFSPNNFDEITLTDEVKIEFFGSVYSKGWAFITYTLYFMDSDGVGEAILVKESHNILIGENQISLANNNSTSDSLIMILITLLMSVLLTSIIIIILLLKPKIRRFISNKLLPSKINRSLDYPTDKIIVDGSNVAWDEPTPDGRADIENLALAVKELENAGFKDIRVIVDAALRYQVKDTKKFDEMAKKGLFKVLPAKVSGDLFILRLSQQTGAIILTNDLFKEFRDRFKWIDTRRVPFSIMSGQFFLHPIAGSYNEKIEY